MAKSNPEHLDIDVLREAAQLLYGETWQTQMAKALDVNVRTVQRWHAESFNVPGSIHENLAALLRERMTEIKQFLAQH